MNIFMSNIAILAVLGLSACAAQSPTIASEKQAEMVTTIKPGAAVSLSTSVPKSMGVDGYNTIGLNFGESYPDGTLSVDIVPSEGLTVFGGISERNFDMSRGDTHEMSLDVSAAQDGMYFLNLFADAGGQARTFSVSLEIGTVTEAMKKAVIAENGEMQNGVRVLEAEETIR